MVSRPGAAVRVTCALAVAVLAAVAPPSATAAPPSPARDSFYRYSGHAPLAEITPGTVLKARAIQVALGTTSTPIRGEQLLYRTTGQRGEPTATVTTVIAPATLPTRPDIVEYLSFYDGLGPRCDPSYALAGGTASSTDEQQAEEEELLISWYLTNGWVVTVPDFEGTHLHWMAGRQSGYGALDAVRATESYLHVAASTKVAMSGYSGGAVAADWASELAPTYAPELTIVGVAEGGIPVNYLHMFAYVDGTDEFSAAIPGMLLGLSRAYHVDLRHYLSPYGAKVVRQERAVCIASAFGHYPGLTVTRLLKPRYRGLHRAPALRRIVAAQTMGRVPGHPKTALFMGIGKSDDTGDGVMVAKDVEALARHYCDEGVPVQLEEYQGAPHQFAGAFFEPEVGAFLQARFAGIPFTGNCDPAGTPRKTMSTAGPGRSPS